MSPAPFQLEQNSPQMDRLVASGWVSNDHDEASMWLRKVSFGYVRAAEPLTLINLDEARARIEQQLALASRGT